jgi:DNA-directed RNA polymerase specialized sigma24 family protein
VTVDPVEALGQEWQQLARGSLRVRLRTWVLQEPALAPFAEPARLLTFLHGPAPWTEKDHLLLPLVRIARDEPLAARLVLQALLPGFKAIAGRVLHDRSERDDLWELLLAHAWTQIRRYPLERRPRRIAANLLLDTLNRTMRDLKLERSRRRHEVSKSSAVARQARDQRAKVLPMLVAAVKAEAISSFEARLIFAVRIEQCPLAEIAAEERLAYNVLRVRLQRAERRLLLHLGCAAVPNRRAKGPSSHARVIDASRTGRTRREPR